MLDLTKKMMAAAMSNDGTITKDQQSAVMAILDGRTAAAEPVPRVIPYGEASRLFGVSTKQLRVWCRAGKPRRVYASGDRKRSIGVTEKSVRALAEGMAD